MPNPFADGRFRFAVGIEDTFVPQLAIGRRALDEYELTQHYWRWQEDLALARDTGATTIRYGFPWYRLNPRPGHFVWDWADRVAERMEELELEVIVDLMHYGTPLWLDNQFLNHDYPKLVAEFAARLAERYRGRMTAFTPLNEPLNTAIFCGETGRWPPHLTGHDGFVKLARALVRGFVATQEAVAEATGGEATFVHVETTCRYPGTFEGVPEDVVELARHRPFLFEDLLTGRVDDRHPLAGYLRRYGFTDDDFAWFADNTAFPDVMGINMYPHITATEFVAGQLLHPHPPREEAGPRLEQLIRAFWERYERPVFVTETSMEGTVEERIEWLDESLSLVARLRGEGIEIVGYTWWPLFDLVDWDFREGDGLLEQYLVRMGMYDLRPDSVGVLERVETPVVERFRLHAQAGLPKPSRSPRRVA